MTSPTAVPEALRLRSGPGLVALVAVIERRDVLEVTALLSKISKISKISKTSTLKRAIANSDTAASANSSKQTKRCKL